MLVNRQHYLIEGRLYTYVRHCSTIIWERNRKEGEISFFGAFCHQIHNLFFPPPSSGERRRARQRPDVGPRAPVADAAGRQPRRQEEDWGRRIRGRERETIQGVPVKSISHVWKEKELHYLPTYLHRDWGLPPARDGSTKKEKGGGLFYSVYHEKKKKRKRNNPHDTTYYKV